jgi:hypothetical protein
LGRSCGVGASNGAGGKTVIEITTSRRPEPSPLERRARADLPHSARSFGRWLRARLVEHWEGVCFWAELDRGDFGVLRQPIHRNEELVADIVALLLTGSENLTVIAWALEVGQPLDDVVAILSVLDVNARRLPRFRCLRLVSDRSEESRDALP